MTKVNNYRSLLNIFRKFSKKDAKETLDKIFNTKNSKIDWGKVPVHMAK